MVASSVALVGVGVRGTAALGRIAAHLRLRNSPPIDLHLVDPFPAGPGAIWRTGQPRELVMNTVSAQSTVFDDPSLGFQATFPGPNFGEWCAGITRGTYQDVDAESEEFSWVRERAREILPWSTPSRELYGRYLRWAFTQIVESLGPHARVHTHEDRATGMRQGPSGFEVTLASGTTLFVDAALLALGWLPRKQPEEPASPHILAGSPIDQGLERIRPNERIAVRGIGMGFIDLLSILTEVRGGRFIPSAVNDRQFSYVPSGQEPRIFAGSRTGLPFLAKPEFGTVPPIPRFDALKAKLPELLGRRPLDFGREILPLIDHAAAREHYSALAELQPESFHMPPEEFLQLFEDSQHPSAWRAFERRALPDELLRYAPERISVPVQGATAQELDEAIVQRIMFDAQDAALGYASPRKRGLHVYQAARSAIIPLTAFGGVTRASVPELDSYLRIANLIGSGPPLFRVEQLLALHRAGIVSFVGPNLEVQEEPPVGGGLLTRSALAPADLIRVERVVDAYLDLPNVTELHDPLIDSLLDAGLARVWNGNPGRPTLEITQHTSALVDASGSAIPGLHSVGPLHEELRRFTIIAPIPGVGSTVLREIDAAVSAMLTHALDE